MDASDITRKKMARILANIQSVRVINSSNGVQFGQSAINPSLTPSDNTFIASQYPKTDFAFLNNMYPCNSTMCSTIYASNSYNFTVSSMVHGYYYNNSQ